MEKHLSFKLILSNSTLYTLYTLCVLAGFKSQTWTVWIIYWSRNQTWDPRGKPAAPPSELKHQSGCWWMCRCFISVSCSAACWVLWFHFSVLTERCIATLLTAKSVTGFFIQRRYKCTSMPGFACVYACMWQCAVVKVCKWMGVKCIASLQNNVHAGKTILGIYNYAVFYSMSWSFELKANINMLICSQWQC